MSELAAVAAEVALLSDAHLPDTVRLRRGIRTRVTGGTYSAPVWDADPQWTEPARVSPATAPQERLSAGSITAIKEFYVVTRAGVTVPTDAQATATTQHVYRLEWVHGVSGLTDPLMLYLKGTPYRSYRALSKFLVSTEGGV